MKMWKAEKALEWHAFPQSFEVEHLRLGCEKLRTIVLQFLLC